MEKFIGRLDFSLGEFYICGRRARAFLEKFAFVVDKKKERTPSCRFCGKMKRARGGKKIFLEEFAFIVDEVIESIKRK